ncbi:hypothetical protein H7H82_03025 [Mycobacterium heidelbergense]|uniref:CDGP domain-containing protein n=2 Tax=Mycobacterium heidelbergense TaxID=53376 RepID=A0A1X0DNM9_MYCHE|nr:hypothetical protein [Mycobacterium heidelbergense]ORA73996.1 hypothetical protein BST25_11015 [Mycobacterium heidelbergense]
MTLRCVTALAAVTTAVVCALSVAPVATAYPGDPMPGCENGGFLNTVMICDGPIRPDGTWQRCASWQPTYNPGYGGGFYAPGGQQCRVIDLGSIPPLSPDHHIDK